MAVVHRPADRVHLELQPKPGCSRLGKPLIRRPERFQREAGECLGAACLAGAQVDDWLKYRNKPVAVQRRLDPSQSRTQELQILPLGNDATLVLGEFGLVDAEPSREREVKRLPALVPTADL